MNQTGINFNAIVPLAIAGDTDAMTQLVQDFDPLIKSVLKRAQVSQNDFDDVAQECRLSLVSEIIPSWKPSRGPLPALAKTAFRNVINHYRESIRAAKRGGGRADMDIGEALSVSAPNSNPLEILAAQDARDALMVNILQHATPTMRRMVPLLIDGYTPTVKERGELTHLRAPRFDPPGRHAR